MTYLRMMFNAVTLIPGAQKLPPIRARLRKRDLGTGGTSSARYCYSIWLRHLVMAASKGLNTDPSDVAELGPGDSIGAGLAALLCGAERYNALDVVTHANPVSNAVIFDELVELFRARADLPGDAEFADVRPQLADYRFPAHILGEARMQRALQPERVERIRAAVLGDGPAGVIRYRAPWQDAGVVERGSQDLVFSQAVLEHIDALPEAYSAMRDWLKPGGYVSHQIDFKSHGLADTWDGHWCYGDLHWRLLRGHASWFLNRQPYSEHLRLLKEAGFVVLAAQPVFRESSHPRRALARGFRGMSEVDRRTSGAYLLAQRR
jgi:SAM-dependent methyltransferase